MTDNTIPPVIEAWVRQLLDPQFVEIIRQMNIERVDIRLTASRGKVNRQPTIVLNGGVQEMIAI